MAQDLRDLIHRILMTFVPAYRRREEQLQIWKHQRARAELEAQCAH